MTQRDQQRNVRGSEREAWVKPEVERISAGEAELGADTVITEGFFASGS